MGLTVPVFILPALFALIFKAIIYAYTRMVGVTRNLETRLFFLFLLAFVVQNIAEISGGYRLNVNNTMPHLEGRLFYASLVFAIALLFHLAACIAFDAEHYMRRLAPKCVYLCAIGLASLVATPWLIRDFMILDYGFGYSVTRVPGHLYFLFEIYVPLTLAVAVGVLLYGWRHQQTEKKRAKNGVLLLAIIPTVAVMILVVALLHFGVQRINASVTTPLTVTYLLFVSAYGIHHRRFLDIRDRLDDLAALRTKNGCRKLDAEIAALETTLISDALALHNGNQAKAAASLGIRPNTLHYKMVRHGLSARSERRR